MEIAFSSTNNMFLHALHLAISINLELVFYPSYIVYFPLRMFNDSVMNAKIRTIPWLPNMELPKLLTFRWWSLPGCGREHVAVVFAGKGCQYLINECLQPIRIQNTQDAKLTIVKVPLTLILWMGWLPCCGLFCPYKLSKYRLCITATKSLCNYLSFKTTHCWCSVDADFNVLCSQYLLPSITVFIIIRSYS